MDLEFFEPVRIIYIDRICNRYDDNPVKNILQVLGVRTLAPVTLLVPKPNIKKVIKDSYDILCVCQYSDDDYKVHGVNFDKIKEFRGHFILKGDSTTIEFFGLEFQSTYDIDCNVTATKTIITFIAELIAIEHGSWVIQQIKQNVINKITEHDNKWFKDYLADIEQALTIKNTYWNQDTDEIEEYEEPLIIFETIDTTFGYDYKIDFGTWKIYIKYDNVAVVVKDSPEVEYLATR